MGGAVIIDYQLRKFKKIIKKILIRNKRKTGGKGFSRDFQGKKIGKWMEIFLFREWLALMRNYWSNFKRCALNKDWNFNRLWTNKTHKSHVPLLFNMTDFSSVKRCFVLIMKKCGMRTVWLTSWYLSMQSMPFFKRSKIFPKKWT